MSEDMTGKVAMIVYLRSTSVGKLITTVYQDAMDDHRLFHALPQDMQDRNAAAHKDLKDEIDQYRYLSQRALLAVYN